MRKIYVLTISLLLMVSAWGQEGKEVFPTDDFTVWNVVHRYNSIHDNQRLYAIYGDTIIKNIAYRKMYVLSDTLYHGINEDDYYYAGIRIEGSKVYFRTREDSYRPEIEHESLLYDFNVEVGDVVKHGQVEILAPPYHEDDLLPGGPFEEVESTVEEVFYDEYERKHIKLSNNYNDCRDEWIEGVGSLLGFLWSFSVRVLDFTNHEFFLQCLKVNDKIKYLGKKECDCCFFKLKGGGVSIKSENCPSPFIFHYDEDNRIIELICNVSNGFSFVLFNTLGQKIKEVSLKESVEVIHLVEELSGVFIYAIEEDGVIVGKGKLVVK